MTDLVIKTEEKEEPKVQDNDIKETLIKADAYNKLKEQNDKLEQQLLRQQELQSKLSIGGQSFAGQKVEKSDEELAKEEADRILEPFRAELKK